MIIDDARVGEQVALVAANLESRLTELSRDIQDLIERDIPALRGDRLVISLLEASVAENVGTITHMLRHGIGTAGVDAPTAALEYGRRLAQRDIPAAALIPAYRVGQARDSWLRNRSALLAMRVRSILQGDNPDEHAAQAVLGYQLRQTHVGLVIWIDKSATERDALDLLNDVAAGLANAVGCKPLFVPCDETSAWVWLPLGERSEVNRGELATVVTECGRRFSAALGEPASGIDGFRRTHRQAASAQNVALAGRPTRARVTSFVDVAPIAMMCADLDAARAWVIETLGPLATDSERHERLRESARVFLSTGGSYTVTADELFLHRNTAQYRIQKAEELRGRPLREGRLDVELALLACYWLGKAVLVARTP